MGDVWGSVLLITGKPTHVELKLQGAEAALEGVEQDVRVRDLIEFIAPGKVSSESKT